MKIKKTIQKSIRTARVKAIEIHPSRPLVFVGLYSGTLQKWDPERMTLLSETHISDNPIRTICLLETQDWILVGSDDGNISVLEMGNLKKIKSFEAHSDFIRKISTHSSSNEFLSCSDDAEIKLWKIDREIRNFKTFSGHHHFVMDVAFLPRDSNKFISCSLDGTIKMWSISQGGCIKTFKGHSQGINGIYFCQDPCYFMSGSDDLSVKVWDIESGLCISTLSGHANNVNSVYAMRSFPLLASCSEDGTVKFWNSRNYILEDTLLFNGRIWQIRERNNILIVGTDDELVFVSSDSTISICKMNNSRIFYTKSDKILGCKTESINNPKELSTLPYFPSEISISPSGKLVSLVNEDSFEIFSSLGFRKKFSSKGKDFHFINEEEFVVRNGNIVEFYKKAEVIKNIQIQGIRKFFYISKGYFACLNSGQTVFYSESGVGFFRFNFEAEKIFFLEVGNLNFLFLCVRNKLFMYNVNFEVAMAYVEQEVEIPEDSMDDVFHLVGEYPYSISEWYFGEGVLYFSSNSKLFYAILSDVPYFYNFASIKGVFMGIKNGEIYYLEDYEVKKSKVDLEFQNFQKEVLISKKKDIKVGDEIRNKAISFYESLGMHMEALSICVDVNQKFEIFLKLNMYDDALRLCDSSIKYNKLGNLYLQNKNWEKASECFYKSENWTSLFYADSFGEKKYFKIVGEKCEEEGLLNFSFMAYMKCGEYEKCYELLKGSPYEKVFKETYFTSMS